MICPSRTPGLVLEVSRRIAAELAAEALDPGVDLTMADRMALATLSLAVDAEASRRGGVEPVAGAHGKLATGLALIETAAATSPASARCSGSRYPPDPHRRE